MQATLLYMKTPLANKLQKQTSKEKNYIIPIPTLYISPSALSISFPPSFLIYYTSNQEKKKKLLYSTPFRFSL